MLRGLAALLAACVMATTAMGQTVATQTIDFDKPDEDATAVARAMYGKRFAHVAAKRFWLIEPKDGMSDQLAVQLGSRKPCAKDCEVAVLFHTDNGWANIWREKGDSLAIGELDELTGLKSIIHEGRAWEWDGKNYFAMPYGDVPKYRQASEDEMKLAIDWVKANLNLPETVAPPNLSVVDMDLKSGDEKAIFLQGTAFCGNSECPVLIVDGGKVLTRVDSLGPDVREGKGLRDPKGYKMIEVMHPTTVDIVSPGNGQVALTFGAEPIVRAGTETE